MTTITREQAQKIIEAADEVISALAGTNEDVNPGSDNMLRLWDDLNDRHAPPEVVRELARIALASLEENPVAWLHSDNGLGIPAITRSKNIADSWLSKGWYVQPLYIAQPAPVVHDDLLSMAASAIEDLLEHTDPSTSYYSGVWADVPGKLRAAMLQAGNYPVTPGRLPGGFTIEDAKELHENLVRSHISQALSGEKMKKKDRDADLRWIHGVIVQAAWFVKASLEQTALSGTPPVTTDGWISCSERMPNDKQYVWCWGKSYGWTEYDTFEGYYDWSRNKWWTVTDDGEEPASKVTHWMPLPEPPQEAK